ncbi:MAG: uroporphyrinogen-III C-methyltransferase [Deltaproteobacteria bacterium]|nr:uroporphyrinogen-III C-methyltransferase [Deltaproteobacteria bacterium]
MQKQGKVYIIGAGPGDPGLITVKALQCLRDADVVIYDHLVSAEVLGLIGENSRLIYAGKQGAHHPLPQDEINALILKEAGKGNIVARLKGGDPFIFGRGGEEAFVLAQAGLPFEIVPGVSSAVAAPAYAGIPLTHRSYSSTVAFVTGHEAPAKEDSHIDWKALATAGTLVVLMGVKNLPRIVAKLTSTGKDPATPAALIRWGTTPDQETIVATLRDIVRVAEERHFRPPAVFVVGGVVSLREQLNWFEKQPLFGKGVVITRPQAQAEEFAQLLRRQGARVIYFPTIKIVPAAAGQQLDWAIGHVEAYQWLIFTSANGAGLFFQRFSELGRDIRDLKGVRICTIGPATAAVVEERGIKVDLIPESFVAEGVVRAFQNQGISGQRILLPRAEVARDVIPEGLAQLGAQMEVVDVYRTVSSGMEGGGLKELIGRGDVDVLTFTSPSIFKNFMKIMGKDFHLPAGIRIACIGPVTAAAVKKAGLQIDIMPEKYTIPGLVEAMVNYFGKTENK